MTNDEAWRRDHEVTGDNWQGRRPKGEQDTHSFKAFVARIRPTKAGQDHLARHHRGYNPGA